MKHRNLFRQLAVLMLSVLILASVLVFSGGAAAEYIVDMDFNTISEMKSLTWSNGAKATFQVGETSGWLSPKCSFVKDGDTQVFHFVRDDGRLHGWDINTLKDLTGSSVVFSMTFKYAEIAGGAALDVGMVDQSKTVDTGDKWYYSLVIYNGGEVYVDFSGKDSNTFNKSKGNYAGKITPDEYHTISVVYDLTNVKQSYYIDGKETLVRDGYLNGSRDYAPGKVTRFKVETLANEGNVDVTFKNVRVYNAELPVEATSASSAITDSVAALEAYVNLEDYRADDQTAVSAIISEYKTKIEASATAEDAFALLAEAKTKLDEILTDAEKTAAEAFEKLQNDGKTMLRELVDLSKYSEKNQAAIQKILEQAVKDIDRQTDETALNKIVTIAKNKILAVKTLEQEAEDANKGNEKDSGGNGTAGSDAKQEETGTSSGETSGCKSTVSIGALALLLTVAAIPAVLTGKKRNSSI